MTVKRSRKGTPYLLCAIPLFVLFYSQIYGIGRGGEFLEELSGSSGARQLLQAVENNSTGPTPDSDDIPCSDISKHNGKAGSCSFVLTTPACRSGTYIEYLSLRYCTLRNWPRLSLVCITSWLLILFFLLGNTAADHFCPSLEQLADLLQLSPILAGVTLLPLGNGAPDVFASVASFMGAGAGDVGLNSVLGAAVFVTLIVCGAVAISGREIELNQRAFLSNVGCFILVTLALLALILARSGIVHFYHALAFTSLYAAYVAYVITLERRRASQERGKRDANLLLVPLASAPGGGASGPEGVPDAISGGGGGAAWDEQLQFLGVHHLGQYALHGHTLPQWMWNAHVSIFASDASIRDGREADGGRGSAVRPLWGWSDEQEDDLAGLPPWHPRKAAWLAYHVLLVLPRQLTVPSIREAGWSRMRTSLAAAMSPLLLAVLWGHPRDEPLQGLPLWAMVLILGGTVGAVSLAVLSKERPPSGRLVSLVWVLWGFVMSVVWIYLIANELVATLVALGVILGIRPALLGLTVLAWGNSIGDLVSNITIAKGGEAEMAITGSYAGPMFNMLVGLGLSLMLATSASYPQPFVLPSDASVVITLGFLLASLVLAAVAIPLSGGRITRAVGCCQVALYLVFMAVGAWHQMD
eukprot:jgi/Mesvir1/4705/Mv05631-RA.1